MGNLNEVPKREGPNPYTRSGAPPPKLIIRKDKDAPIHRVNDPMSLQLHMADERIRTAGLSPAEREWRRKWLQDQNMHPDEPIHVDAVHRQMNPIRTLYRWPLDTLYKSFLRPTFGAYYGTAMRIVIPKYFWLLVTAEFFYYIWKYEGKNWQRIKGITSYPYSWDHYSLHKEHDKETLELGIRDPSKHEYFDWDFYARFKSIDVDLGPPKRPW